MRGLNKPETLYTYKMIWYKVENFSNSKPNYSQTGKSFTCNYAKTQDINRLGLNQGVVSDNLTIETMTSLPIKIKDKVVFNNRVYYVQNVIEDNNPLSGSRFTNKPSLYTKYIILS